MCCGSGSIVAAVLKEALRRNPEITLGGLVRASTGFDVDPLAVILAKTTWVVTLASQLQGATDDVVIPIYHADSLFATTPVTRRMPQPGAAEDYVVELDAVEWSCLVN
jgi:methylase of polypeptide subunit release factors